MPAYTLQDIADVWGVGKRTVSRRVSELKKKKKFKKITPGKLFGDTDVEKLSTLCGFTWQPRNAK